LPLLALGGCARLGLSPNIDRPASEKAHVESDVKLALIEADEVDAAAISVTAADDGGPVTLGGFVASEAERAAALVAARSAITDRDLLDEIEVRR